MGDFGGVAMINLLVPLKPWSRGLSTKLSHSAIEQVSRAVRNQKVHYRLYNSPSLNPVLNQMNPLQTPPRSSLLKIRLFHVTVCLHRVFRPKYSMHFSSLLFLLHSAHFTLLDLIILMFDKEYELYEALRSRTASSLILLPNSYFQIFSSAHCTLFPTYSICFFSLLSLVWKNLSIKGK